MCVQQSCENSTDVQSEVSEKRKCFKQPERIKGDKVMTEETEDMLAERT